MNALAIRPLITITCDRCGHEHDAAKVFPVAQMYLCSTCFPEGMAEIEADAYQVDRLITLAKKMVKTVKHDQPEAPAERTWLPASAANFIAYTGQEACDAPCYGGHTSESNHPMGTCGTCGAEVAKHSVKNHLMPVEHRGTYGARQVGCWRVHRCDAERAKLWQAARAEHIARGEIVRGQHVTVTKGRKVPKGTTGEVIWTGESDFGKRVGIRTEAGETHFLAEANVTATSQLPTDAQ